MRVIITERETVAQAIRLIMPEYQTAAVVGRRGVGEVIASLVKGDEVAGNINIPNLARITSSGAKFFQFGVSASKERLDASRPTAEDLTSAEFKGRLQEYVAYRDVSSPLPEKVEVYDNQLREQICALLEKRGVEVTRSDRVHPSNAEIVERLTKSGLNVSGKKYGVGRIGRGWGGRTVVGCMMPRHAAEYCTAGADYFHLEFPGVVDVRHNSNWTPEEMGGLGATFVRYEVWRWGKTACLFRGDGINL